MGTLKVVLTVLHLLIAFGLIATVLFQSSKSQGLSGSIAGGAETFFGKNKGKTMDSVLAKLTVVLAILFVITSVSLSFIDKKNQQETPADANSQVQEIPAADAEAAPAEDAADETDTTDAEEAPAEETEAE